MKHPKTLRSGRLVRHMMRSMGDMLNFAPGRHPKSAPSGGLSQDWQNVGSDLARAMDRGKTTPGIPVRKR